MQLVLLQLLEERRQLNRVAGRDRFVAVLGILVVVAADTLGIGSVVDNHNLVDFDPKVSKIRALAKIIRFF